MGPSRREPHELEIEVRSPRGAWIRAGVTYSGSYIPLSSGAGAELRDPEPICMFCHNPALSWIVEFRESDDPSYGHVNAAGCCDHCHALVDAGAWVQLTSIHADFISGRMPLAQINISRADHLYRRTRPRSRTRAH
jgi:hypothetical protein